MINYDIQKIFLEIIYSFIYIYTLVISNKERTRYYRVTPKELRTVRVTK